MPRLTPHMMAAPSIPENMASWSNADRKIRENTSSIRSKFTNMITIDAKMYTTAMSGTTREAKFAIRRTPPMMMTASKIPNTTALIRTSVPQALCMAAATPLA